MDDFIYVHKIYGLCVPAIVRRNTRVLSKQSLFADVLSLSLSRTEERRRRRRRKKKGRRSSAVLRVREGKYAPFSIVFRWARAHERCKYCARRVNKYNALDGRNPNIGRPNILPYKNYDVFDDKVLPRCTGEES